MKPGAPIVIEPSANGWIVRELLPPDSFWPFAEMHVFQFLDYDDQGVQGDRCLAGFLVRHYRHAAAERVSTEEKK